MYFFFKQKTAYEMRISDWSSDVCSSDLSLCPGRRRWRRGSLHDLLADYPDLRRVLLPAHPAAAEEGEAAPRDGLCAAARRQGRHRRRNDRHGDQDHQRSEEHTSELQSLMSISYADFCLQKKTKTH